jgi:hypothetical protein
VTAKDTYIHTFLKSTTCPRSLKMSMQHWSTPSVARILAKAGVAARYALWAMAEGLEARALLATKAKVVALMVQMGWVC